MLSLNPQPRIHGICPLTAVPFREDGSVDYAQFDRLIGSLMKTGVNGIGLFGVVSEFYKLTDAEKSELAHRMLKQMEGSGAYSLISVTDHATEIAVRRCIEMKKIFRRSSGGRFLSVKLSSADRSLCPDDSRWGLTPQSPNGRRNFSARGCLFLPTGVQSNQRPRQIAAFGKGFGGEEL